MKNLLIRFPFFALIVILAISCSSDDDTDVDDSRPPMSEVPDLYFQWSIDGIEYVADSDYQGVIQSSFNNALYVEGATGSSVTGDFLYLRINNDGPPSISTGDSFTMDPETNDEITLILLDGTKWSTTNPGGSGTCNVTQYQAYKDVLFNIDFIEGNYSATLTSLTESGSITVENGSFGLFVRR